MDISEITNRRHPLSISKMEIWKIPPPAIGRDTMRQRFAVFVQIVCGFQRILRGGNVASAGGGIHSHTRQFALRSSLSDAKVAKLLWMWQQDPSSPIGFGRCGAQSVGGDALRECPRRKLGKAAIRVSTLLTEKLTFYKEKWTHTDAKDERELLEH